MTEPDIKFTLEFFSHNNRDAVQAFAEGAKNEANQHDVLLAIEQAISRVLESINGEEYTVYVDIGPALQALLKIAPDDETETDIADLYKYDRPGHWYGGSEGDFGT